jgi:hypothetical protein
VSRPLTLADATIVPTPDELAEHQAGPDHRLLAGLQRAATATPRGGPTIDPEQSQLRMIAGGDGFVYSVQADGRLLGYRHLGAESGEAVWDNGGVGVLLDSGGWHHYETVLAAEDGQLFAFGADGTVRWFRYLHDRNDWAPNGGSVVGQGFDAYPRIFGGWGGVIYAADRTGDLYWFRYLAGDGSTGEKAWANDGRGALIKSDTQLYLQYVADQDGVIYGIRQGASLDWFRYLDDAGQGGPEAWANDGDPVQLSFGGWTQEYQREVIACRGTVYSVFIDRANPPGPDHELYWFRLMNWQDIPANGTPNWASPVGRLVGTGWTTCRTANLQAHTDRPSAANGENIEVAVSSTLDDVTASLLRIAGPLPEGGSVVWGPEPVGARLQLVQPGYRRSGTGWSYDLTIPLDGLASGFHVVRLTGPLGMQRYAPLVVRPVTPGEQIAVMLPFLSHNAYNTWGGHGQYTWDEHPGHKFAPLHRPYANLVLRESGTVDARWLSDLFLLRWLAGNEIAYDCYQDTDLHADGDWLGQYRALVLGTHPEYWTPTMRSRLVDYLGGGGRVIYTGGNGIYESVDLVDADTGMSTAVHRDANGIRALYRLQGLPEQDVLGVAFGGEYMTFLPYRVELDHPFLAGTGLGVGDEFGATGYNGAASGWEMDQTSGTNPAVTVIARGLQAGGGAHLSVFDKPDGGWVFAAGSLTFNGALDDPAVSGILRNVFAAAVE